MVPSFVGNIVGKSLCVSMLSMVKSEGFENTWIYGKRGGWFQRNMPVWMDDSDGSFRAHRKNGMAQVRNKFTDAKQLAK